MIKKAQTIYNFNPHSDISPWQVIDDDVMGGKSSGNFDSNKKGHGVFHGKVSLKNNGGFSLLRYQFKKIKTVSYTKIVIYLKGDGKLYQFRIKAKATDYYSYISLFKTTNKWETIEIPLSEMYPAFRGRKLDMANYSNDGIEQIAFLIGNKKAEGFTLIIDSITLK